MKTKEQMQPYALTGISSLFAMKGGFTSTAATGQDASGTVVELDETKMCEFPCSEDSGFNYNEGTPNTDGHKIHGLGVYWIPRLPLRFHVTTPTFWISAASPLLIFRLRERPLVLSSRASPTRARLSAESARPSFLVCSLSTTQRNTLSS